MSENPENPNALLEEIRGGAQRTFDAPELCHLLIQMLAHPDYWDDEGYLTHMQFHRDEVRTIANFMSIGIGASAGHASHPEPSESLLGTAEHPGEPAVQLDSAVLGEFVCDTTPQSETDN